MLYDDTRYVNHTLSDDIQLVRTYLNDSLTDKGLLSAHCSADKETTYRRA